MRPVVNGPLAEGEAQVPVRCNGSVADRSPFVSYGEHPRGNEGLEPRPVLEGVPSTGRHSPRLSHQRDVPVEVVRLVLNALAPVRGRHMPKVVSYTHLTL